MFFISGMSDGRWCSAEGGFGALTAQFTIKFGSTLLNIQLGSENENVSTHNVITKPALFGQD